MTTNNPPIAAWAPSTALHKLASRHNNAPCILTDGPAEFNDVALVRLVDYKALQAAYEEELFCVRQDRDAHFGELMRALEQVDAMKAECERWKQGSEIRDEQNQDLHSFIMELKAECEELRKDAERYRWLRRGGNDDIGVVMGFDGIDCGSTSVAYTYEEGLCGERMDAAIDAAMQEERNP